MNSQRLTAITVGCIGCLALVFLVMIGLRAPAPIPSPPRRAPAPVSAAAPTPRPTPAPTAAASPAPRATPDPNATPLPPPAPDPNTEREMIVEPFTGVVLDGDHFQPIPGALVEGYVFDEGRLRLEQDGNYPTRVAQVTADANGHFRLPPQEIGSQQVYAYRATAPGRGAAIRLFPAGKGMTDKPNTGMILETEGAISGSVVDQDGQPVANALVGDIVMGGRDGPGYSARALQGSSWTRSDAAGHFTLKSLNSKIAHFLPGRAPGYIPGRSPEVSIGATDARIVLTAAEGSLSGLVLEADGTPVPGAIVSVLLISRQVEGGRSQETSTDTAGRFQFPELLAGDYTVTARAPVQKMIGYARSVETRVAVHKGAAGMVELRLPAPVSVTATFKDRDSGAGVADVVVFMPQEDAAQRAKEYQVKSGPDGVARFTCAITEQQGGDYMVLPVAWPKNYLPVLPAASAAVIVSSSDLRLQALKGGTSVAFEVLLQKAPTLHGRVVEPDGKTPGANLPVFLVADHFFNSVVTDGQGQFDAAVPPAARLKVEAASDLGIANTQVTTPVATEVVLNLLAYGQLAGQVVHHDGSGIPNIDLKVGRTPSSMTYAEALRFGEDASSHDDGSFRIEHVAPGDIRIDVQLGGGSAFIPPRPQTMTVQPGSTLDGLRIVLEQSDYIEGIVVDDATGSPIPDVTISTSDSGVGATSAADGHFRLSGMVPDKPLAFVTAAKRGYLAETRNHVTIYDGDLEFRLKAPTKLLVTVKDSSGGVPAEYRLRVLKAAEGGGWDPQAELLVTDPAQPQEFTDLVPGHYRAEAQVEGGTAASGAEEFDLADSGGSLAVEVRLSGGALLAGVTVDGSTKAPVAGAVVRLLNPPVGMAQPGPPGAPGTYLEATSDGSGQFHFGPLPPGTYTLTAETATASCAAMPAVLPGGGNGTPVTLALVPSARVFGGIIGSDGKPAPSASIFLLRDGTTQEGQAMNAKGGTYSVRPSSAGTWGLLFSIDGTQDSTQRTVVLTPGQELQLDVDFSGRVELTGAVRVDGSQPPGEPAILLRSTGTLGDVVLVPGDPGPGRYTTRCFPGDYIVLLSWGEMAIPTGEVFNLAGGAAVQHDFVVATGVLQVLIDMPAGSKPSGTLKIERQAVDGSGISIGPASPVQAQETRTPGMPAGSYRAVFKSSGGVESVSDWVPVSRGGEGSAVVTP